MPEKLRIQPLAAALPAPDRPFLHALSIQNVQILDFIPIDFNYPQSDIHLNPGFDLIRIGSQIPDDLLKPLIQHQSVETILDRHTEDGQLFIMEPQGLRCTACGHRCLLRPGQRGVCKVRFNEAGRLRVPFGYVAGMACDPIEKKPFYHVLPGTKALTFGMLGCNFHCDFCQNWFSSQVLRDPLAEARTAPITPEKIVLEAKRHQARFVVSSYNEPLITPEWAASVFHAVKKEQLGCAIVSNGHATPEAVDFWAPLIDAIKVDLKCFNSKTYLKMGGKLQSVLDTIQQIHQRGIWLEIVTLVIPGVNDSAGELADLAGFLASISRDIPWHVTAFHGDYRMSNADRTQSDDLLRAAQIGAAAGLRFVYAGNLPGRVGSWENTRCPGCSKILIQRSGFDARVCHKPVDNQCPFCGCSVPGIWS